MKTQSFAWVLNSEGIAFERNLSNESRIASEMTRGAGEELLERTLLLNTEY